MTEQRADARLAQQIQFIVEMDRLKRVLRRSYHTDRARRENDAEHSWHLAVMALLLQEYAPDPAISLLRVLKMVLVHDVVEIDAGDTFCYDDAGAVDKAQRESAAANRIFALLPADQAAELRGLWEEFEAGGTPEARFANALDRLQPLLMNYHSQGAAWREHGINAAQVLARNRPIISQASTALDEYVAGLVADAVAKGFLAPAPGADDQPR